MPSRLWAILLISVLLHWLAFSCLPALSPAPQPSASAPLKVALIQGAVPALKAPPVAPNVPPAVAKNNQRVSPVAPRIAGQNVAQAQLPAAAVMTVTGAVPAEAPNVVNAAHEGESAKISSVGASGKTAPSEPEAPGPITQPASFSAGYLNNPLPDISLSVRQRCQSGLLLLRVVVSANGKPSKVQLEKTSGCDAYDRSALETVRSKWRFEPAKRGTTAVESEVQVPIRLNLLD